MHPLNYAARAREGLEVFSGRLRASGFAGDARNVTRIVSIINAAMHFQLPDRGVMFDDDFRGIRDQDYRLELPAEMITVSFHVPLEAHHGPEHLNRVALRRCAVAWDAGDRIFMCSTWEMDGQWITSPVGLVFEKDAWEPKSVRGEMRTISDSGDASRARLAGRPFVILPYVIPDYERSYGPGDSAMRVMFDDNADIGSVFELIEALSCSNVTHDPIQRVSKEVNARRKNQGKRPLDEIRVLVIEAPKRTASSKSALGGTHASPREHLRRGHIRRYENGVRKWISSTVVNPGSARGFVEKTYSVRRGKPDADR